MRAGLVDDPGHVSRVRCVKRIQNLQSFQMLQLCQLQEVVIRHVPVPEIQRDVDLQWFLGC